MTLQNTAKDYSKYCDVNLQSKLEPVNKCIDDIFARLEEFQTMMSFVKQDRRESLKVLTSLLEHQTEFNDLCKKIDAMESLVGHIKNNLDKLEDDINKAETSLHISEPATKVANIFTPLFKKSQDKKSSSTQHLELFQTKDYFYVNENSDS